MIGYTNSGGGDYDAWLIKTDAEGGEQWNSTFGGIKNDFAYAVQPTADGGYTFVGHTESYGAELSDAWLVKVGGEAAETTKSPITHSTEEVSGFGAFMAIMIISLAACAFECMKR